VAEAIALAALQGTLQSCTRCPALVRSRSCVVPGAGAAQAAVAFVGLAPGRFGGDRTGLPFSGDRSGDLLHSMIRHAHLDGVFITNLVRCNPRDARGRNRDPDRREIENCRIHLEAELGLVRPVVVACLGRLAWRELAGRGAPFSPRRPQLLLVRGLKLYPMYHPAYVNRGACSRRAYAAHFTRLARLIRGA
jgi:uracil-DNA glycosylase family 4